jgi:hypothetical protein
MYLAANFNFSRIGDQFLFDCLDREDWSKISSKVTLVRHLHTPRLVGSNLSSI